MPMPPSASLSFGLLANTDENLLRAVAISPRSSAAKPSPMVRPRTSTAELSWARSRAAWSCWTIESKRAFTAASSGAICR